MCNTSLQQRNNFGDSSSIEPLSLSTFHFLRSCNRFMIPSTDCHSYYGSLKENNFPTQFHANENSLKGLEDLHVSNESPRKSPILDVIETISLPTPTIASPNSHSAVRKSDNKDSTDQRLKHHSPLHASSSKSSVVDSDVLQPTSMLKQNDLLSLSLPSLPLFPAQNTHSNAFLSSSKPTLPAFEYITGANPSSTHNNEFALMELNRFSGIFPAFLHRRPRGEKRPIPEEQKDEKYYERRKRNNEAAKKSRDARKIREDRIAFRAALLEQENSILRAQILALRDQLRAVRQLVNSSMTTTVFPERTSAVFESVQV